MTKICVYNFSISQQENLSRLEQTLGKRTKENNIQEVRQTLLKAPLERRKICDGRRSLPLKSPIIFGLQ